ncbi:MAG: AAA family ATPase [Polyangiales bacterium]
MSRLDMAEGLETSLLKARLKARLLGGALAEPELLPRLGRFVLVRRLGVGGEGTVFEARDPHGGALVALKQLHPSAVASATSLTREFRALADIVHPNLVALHELFCVDEQWFYSMERVLGTDIVRSLGRSSGGPRDDAQLRSAFVQLLRGLAAIHAADKLHRDLKPRNVLVDPDGRVVILDYGTVINRPHDVLAQSDSVGTPAYAAPEQIRGAPLPASDLYAVGVILFEVLTGRTPFDGPVPDLLVRKQRERPPAPRALDPGIAPDLDALCVALLARDAADRPTLDDALSRLSPSEPARRAPPPREDACFVGREAHLQALAALAAPARVPTIALVHGESGVGKSALLGRLCESLRDAGARVIEGRCHEREHTPFKVFGGMIAQLARHVEEVAPALLDTARRAALARLFPELRALDASALEGDASEARAQAFSAVRALLAALAEAGPVVLAVDDLQWGDLDSIRLLEHVFAGSDAPPIVFVGVYRGSERASSPFLRTALSEGSLRGLATAHAEPRLRLVERELEPLDADDARRLLRALSHGDAPPSARTLDAEVSHARGLPFALQQLARRPRGLNVAQVVGIDALVQQRIAERSAPARQLLELLCVAGRPLSTTLALCASESGSEGWRAARELCSNKLARWLETDVELSIEPYHDLIRAALVRQVPAARARALHASVVAAMEALGMDEPEHAMVHLVGAGEDARAGLAALAAADRAAQQLAWNHAASLLGRARLLLAPGTVPAHALCERLGHALAAADRHRDAAAAYREAAADAPDVDTRQRLHALAAQQLMRAGATAEGVALFEQLLREIGLHMPQGDVAAGVAYVVQRVRQRCAPTMAPPAGPRDARSEARLNVLAAVQSELWLPQPVQSCVVHAWLFREARRHRDGRWVFALAGEIAQLSLKYGTRGTARCERLLAELEEVAAELGEPRGQALALFARASYLLHCHGKPRSALPLLEGADALLARHCPGSSFERGWLAMIREVAYEVSGDYRALLASVAERERLTRSDSYAARLLLASAPLARLVEDRADDAQAFLTTHWPGHGDQPLVDVLAISRQAEVLLYRGDARGAHAMLSDVLRRAPTRGPLSSRVITDNLVYELARAALAWHHRAPSPALRREVTRTMRWRSSRHLLGEALLRLLSASLAYADGLRDRARALLAEAIPELEHVEADAYAWCARVRLAQLDGADRDLARAYAWFRERGVRRPDRWVGLSVPGPDHW